MEEEYAQSASPVSTLRAILDGYPLSAGIFKELLQNSDDAGASKQIFVLDERNHSAEGLFSKGLAPCQGPAFMAFNDAILRTQDWEALKSIHESSKVADELKIGKFGVGFRTVFNLTDSPQILSDNHLAIFDPLRLHLESAEKKTSAGKKLDLRSISSEFPNQLLPFSFFMKDGLASPFLGTVIRCPLRNAPSGISDQVVHGGTISKLFEEFMEKELDISCLFLNSIKSIEIYEVASTGTRSLLAKMTISRSDPVQSTMFKATVALDRNGVSEKKEWQIIQKKFSRDEAVDILLQQPGYNPETVTRTLQGAKFSPEVKIAIDVTRPIHGRLFTYLPLPIFTGFPVHIHALFGIDTSRAHLRRASVGLMSGSQDHMKVQWNKMLFQTFIPRTWSYLLEEMISRELVSDVFSIWPPERSAGELEPYYAPLSGQLVDTLLSSKAAVWPVFELPNQSTQFRSLDALVVASPTERVCVLQALAKVGLSFTRPPKYIFELLCKPSGDVSILNPEVAHRLLLDKVNEITQASEGDQELLLEYLLSTKNILNICDLPLVPVSNGEKVTISNAPRIPVYTILTRSEFDIFGPCDDVAIALHRLPPHVASTLLELGPRSVNVQRLTVPRIIKYLSLYSNHLNSHLSESRSNLSASAVVWLSRFWEWIDTYEHRDELFPQIQNLALLPSTKGLKTANSILFKLRGEHHAYTMGYLALGIPFLPMHFSDAAHNVLQRYRLANSISDLPALLDSMALTCPAKLSHPDCESILKHLASRLDESTSQDSIQRVRSIPVFPLLASTMNGNSSSVTTNWTAIPYGHSIRSVGRPRFVPLVNGISFVGLDSIVPTLVKFLEPSHPNPMLEIDLVELAVENLTTQPEHLQLALLRHITDNRNRIIQDVINKLGRQAFVLADDGTYHVPGDVVDPDSDIGQLYIGCAAHLPSRSSSFCMEIVRCLRSLGLLRAKLDPEIVAERVEFISSRHTSDEALSISRSLLSLLGSSGNLDFSLVPGISEKKWLPTNRGLCSADECRHADLTSLALFDNVLAILEPFTIPPSLQGALRWDQPLRIDLLIRQLDSLIDFEHGYDAVVDVVKEFGRREWRDEDRVSLERTVRDRQWVPTTGTMLADVKSSVFNFSPTMINSGFYQIRTDLKAENILRQMGCEDHPSTRAVLDKLCSLHQGSNHVDLVGTSISLLRCIPDDITTMERDELLIPDTESQLRPFSEIFYNDIGENYRLVNSDGHFIAHQSLDESLVLKLGLNRLGLKYAELRNIGPDMGQAPITTVRRTLQQYTNKQFLLEFVANAEDAKATEFTVAVNFTTVSAEQNLRVLSPAMVYLCRLPSLVVHNNAQFTPQDFEGICNTSVGGKEGRTDTIGEFGQGVLTMYHFTDLAMVISGSRVLFLDPSKKHLPLPDRASLILQLRCVQQFYKDHLIALDGLFDFNMSLPSYNGTLFVLPLRVLDGTNHPIIPDFWSPERITSEILEPFKKYAGDCLLFTSIHAIRCITRADGVVTQCWSFQTQKTPITGSEAGYVVTDVEIIKSTNSIARWKTVTTSRTKDQLPSEFRVEPSLIRKPSFAGLAARLDRASDGHSFNFFSTLPLSTPTTLPMHVMASFVLSSDRRQIRLDRFEELQTKYNTWLLEKLIPPLYLFFLEHLLVSEDVHYRLRWPSEKGDTISNHIVDSFYSSKHLKASPRDLFSGHYSPLLMLSPQNAVLHSDDIRLILDRLKPQSVVDLPPGPRELAGRAGLRTVDPSFVKDEIMRNPGAITSGDNFQMILDIILYLACQADSPDILNGLPILPIENGSFGTLDTRGTSKPYYLWRPKKEQARKHNFDEGFFVHPRMKFKDLEKFKLNVHPLSATPIKGFVAAKLSTFTEPSMSEARVQWTDSFWDSWDEYTSLGLKHEHIESFPLVPMILPPSFVSLEQCKKGDVLLLEGDSQETRDLRTCLRELRLSVVHVGEYPRIPSALCQILVPPNFPPFKLQTVLSAITRTGTPIPDLFGALNDDLRKVFADWARKNISDIPDNQICYARALPIWRSAGRGAPEALRSASEVELLPENLTLQDAAAFMAGCVAEDPLLTHLNIKRISLSELHQRLHFPDLDTTTLLRYKEFYKKCPSDCRRHLQVPTNAYTFQYAKDLFKREPFFTAVFPEDPSLFVNPAFEEFEKELIEFGLQSEEGLDMRTFKTCAQRLEANDPTAVPRAREVFRTFREILPSRVTKQPHTWHELDDIPFIPRRMDAVRKIPLSNLDESEPGLEIPPEVTCLEAIVPPVDLVREEFEAIAWSQRACFEVQPDPGVYREYPALGTPSPSQVLAHLRYLSRLTNLRMSQRQILLHDVKRVYKYFDDEHFKKNEELAQTILLTLRHEALFLNIDGNEESLNWVKGSSLAIDCHLREGPVQGVCAFLRPFEEVLLGAGAMKVHHPSFTREHDNQHPESPISSIFDQLRRDKALTDVVFEVEGDPNPEPLFAHRTFLAVSSETFRNSLCLDSQESRDASLGCPLKVKVPYSWQCVRSFLDYIYTRSKGGRDFPLELLLEILDISNTYKVMDLFDEVQGEIIERRFLRPETVDKIKAVAEKQQAKGLLDACRKYKSENIEFIRAIAAM